MKLTIEDNTLRGNFRLQQSNSGGGSRAGCNASPTEGCNRTESADAYFWRGEADFRRGWDSRLASPAWPEFALGRGGRALTLLLGRELAALVGRSLLTRCKLDARLFTELLVTEFMRPFLPSGETTRRGLSLSARTGEPLELAEGEGRMLSVGGAEDPLWSLLIPPGSMFSEGRRESPPV